MIERRTGLLWRDEPILSTRKLSAKRGAIGNFPDEALPETEIQREGDVRDQGRTQSCTGHAISDCARTACFIQTGEDPGPVSALFNYATARIEEGDPKFEMVGSGWQLWSDEGAYPNALMIAAERRGFVLEKDWPFDPDKVNNVPDFGAMVSGDANCLSLGQWESISTVLEARRAYHANATVMIAMNITDQFMNNTSGYVDSMDGESKGGHMMATRGYGSIVVKGVRRFGLKIVNSWGPDFGADGFCIVSDRMVVSKFMKAMIAMKASPIRKAS